MIPKKFYSTKEKREKAALRLQAVAAHHGAAFERDESPADAREIVCHVSIGPYRCMVFMDATTAVALYMAHWSTSPFSGAKYPRDFGVTVDGSVNEFHFGKATTYAYSFDDLLSCIADGLARLRDMPAESV